MLSNPHKLQEKEEAEFLAVVANEQNTFATTITKGNCSFVFLGRIFADFLQMFDWHVWLTLLPDIFFFSTKVLSQVDHVLHEHPLFQHDGTVRVVHSAMLHVLVQVEAELQAELIGTWNWYLLYMLVVLVV